MTVPAMHLDFASGRPRVNAAGVVLVAAGLASIVALSTAYMRVRDQGDGLALKFDSLTGSTRADAAGGAEANAIAEADAVVQGLSTPWARLLDDIEAANSDSKENVALLAIEPDREHQKVRIFAESRTLPAAIAYVERLQKSSTLRYPLLKSHEVQEKDPYRPVRFQIVAGWRVAP
jgi:hypothetical protein